MRGSEPGIASEFIREVDEAVRQDRWVALGQRYGAYVIGAALAIVVGTAAGVGWRSYQAGQQADQARRYAGAIALIGQDKPTEAAEALRALAADAGGGLAVIARFRAAQAFGEAGDTDKQIEVLQTIESDSRAETRYRQLAQLLRLQASFGRTDPAKLEGEISASIDDANPWRHSLMELKALAEIQAGKIDAARATLGELIGDATTPGGMAQRSIELLRAHGGPLPQSDAAKTDQTVSQNDGEVTR